MVQVYVADLSAAADEPDAQLAQFDKVFLQPGETRTVTLDVPERAFAHWSCADHAWQVKPGTREVRVGASSRDIRLTTSLAV